ncbi:MAG TPA: hypothetical protein VF157_03645 [Chloroflexota bacterium]
MGAWAIVAVVVYSVVNTTLVRYQRFALDVARAASADLGGESLRQTRALQRLMTPLAVNLISWLCYVVLAVGFVFGFRIWGWAGGAPILAWSYVGTALLARVWPWPDHAICVRIAAGEVHREGQLRNLEPDEREMVKQRVLERLKIDA